MPRPEKKIYRVWSDDDPNDSFEVAGRNVNEAMLAALTELKWAISAKGREPETPDEKEMCE